MFLHIGFIHIALNMYLLIALGPFVEREFGRLRFSLVYVLSGLFGSIASALWHGHHKVSKSAFVMGQFLETSDLQLIVAAGASGALMGICGAFLGRLLTAGIAEQDQRAIGMKGPLVQTIAINLVMGFLNPGIDNACHIGGLVGGFVLGVAFTMLTFQGSVVRRWSSMLAISAASLGLVWWLAVRPPSPDLVRLKSIVEAELAQEAAATDTPESAPDVR
jgi:membrane associated rhomboid family serine protease